MRRLAIAVLCLLGPFAFGHARNLQDGDLPTDKIYVKVLPSIVTISADKGDKLSIGTGFFAVKEGVIVTAYHVINGAKSAVAKFSDGETFDVSGVVDADPVRDVAILRVKVFGKPLLSVNPADPVVGSKVCAVGAPKGLEFSVSDGIVSQVQTMDGVKQLQFTCPVSPGNSGGPLINGKGEVIGVVDWQYVEGQNLNFAVPMSYVLGLDSSLATKPFDTMKWKAAGARDSSKPSVSSEEFDTALASAILTQRDAYFHAVELCNLASDPAYFKGIQTSSYSIQAKAAIALQTLEDLSINDDTRMRAKQELMDSLQTDNLVFETLIRAYNIALADHNGWIQPADDLLKRAIAVVENVPADATVDKLLQDEKFQARFPALYLEMRSIGSKHLPFRLGVGTFVSDSLYFVSIEKGSIADQMKFRDLDHVTSFNGQQPKDLDDLERMMLAAAGKKVRIESTGFYSYKKRSWEATVPANLTGS